MNVSISGMSSSPWASQTQMASQNDARMERLFSKFDTDGDGTISADELETAKANAKEGSRDAKLLESLTTDSDGGITLEDFKSQMTAQMEQMKGKGQAGGPPPGPPPDATEMFSKIDTNGDGSLDSSELEEMAANGPQGGPSAETMLSEMDADGNGAVTEDEFKAHMEQMQSKMMANMGGQSGSGQSDSSSSTSLDSTSAQALASLLAEALKSYQQNGSNPWSLVANGDGSGQSSGGVYV